MKNFLQSCNMTGSLYGKIDQKKNKKHSMVMKSRIEKDLVTSYEDLYKTQYVTMAKLFNKAK